MVEKSPFSKLEHIGIVVRDMDEAVEYYQSLGIGPFESPKKRAIIERKIRGKPANDVKTEIRVAQMGPVRLELVQPIEGESIPKEFLESKGEGINHLGFLVDDIDKEAARLVKKGANVIMSVKALNGGAVFFDTGKGIILELVQW